MKGIPCGLGDEQPVFSVYIANRPPLDEYQQLQTMRPLLPGEVAGIARQTGNHWRKIFNVYAKLAFALDDRGFESWQAYRDGILLQAGSGQALLFSLPDLPSPGVHLITGKTYAQALPLNARLTVLDSSFQADAQRSLFVTPYFDYRQLNNEKIIRLVAMIRALGSGREL